jgi:septal ring factor EnvC (AmiA/AmiB activator)
MNRQYTNQDRTEMVVDNISTNQNFQRSFPLSKIRSEQSYETLVKILAGWEENAVKLDKLKDQIKKNSEASSQQMIKTTNKLKEIFDQNSQLEKQILDLRNQIGETVILSTSLKNDFETIKRNFNLILFCLIIYLVSAFVLFPLGSVDINQLNCSLK